VRSRLLALAGRVESTDADTHRTDVFTLEGYACSNPLVLDRLMWSLVILTWAVLAVRTWPGLRAHWRSYSRGATASASSARHDAFVSMAAHVAAYVSVFARLAASLIRVSTEWTFGVNWQPTVAVLIWYFLQVPVAVVANHQLLKALLAGALKSPSVERRLLHLDNVLGWTASAVMLGANGGTLVVGLFVERGPTVTRVGLAVLRNVAVAFPFLHVIVRGRVIRRTLEDLRSSLVGSSAVDTDGRHAHVQRLEIVIDQMDKTQRSMVRVAIPVLVCCVMFSVVPQLYVVNYVFLTMMTILTSFGSHVLFTWTRNRDSGASGSGTGADGAVAPGSHGHVATAERTHAAFSSQPLAASPVASPAGDYYGITIQRRLLQGRGTACRDSGAHCTSQTELRVRGTACRDDGAHCTAQSEGVGVVVVAGVRRTASRAAFPEKTLSYSA